MPILANIPMEQWGRDHWSTLLYIESRCVDGYGMIDESKMRTYVYGDKNQPSRLKDGKLADDGHDDWACLNDMIRAGLVVEKEDNHFTLALTDRGWQIASALRRHYAESHRNPNSFEPPKEEVNDVH